MNPKLDLLEPYPFEKLRTLLAGVQASVSHTPIRLSIGEPQHPTPPLIRDALSGALDGLAHYPSTQGSEALRAAIAAWIERRHGVRDIDLATQVLPVAGSREALFSFAQAVIDPAAGTARVLCPNPFYQIYEGAALLAGARPIFYNQTPDNGFGLDFAHLSDEDWRHVRLAYVCSPGNPSGAVLDIDDWRRLFELADRHDFIIASDECYSEIYQDEASPPLGALAAARQLGRRGCERLVVFSSLSKRSNVPGMRSGFVAGDARVLACYLLYRTYHGCAMSPAVQVASIAAWGDEAHVIENRQRYREKFARVQPLIDACLPAPMPPAGFYLWARTPCADTDFARGLYAAYNVTVLPGSYLSRPAQGIHPGAGFIRLALVAGLDECLEAAARIVAYTKNLQ